MYLSVSQFILVFQKSGQYLWSILPYILFGVIFGEVLKLTSWTKLLYRGISKSPFLSITAAVLLGMVSPLCTYGTVPVMLQLYRSGISIAPLVAFLSASSLMNPQLFFITWGGIDLKMAVARTVAVLIFGLIFGYIVHFVPEKWIVNKNILDEDKTSEEILSRPPKEFSWKKFLMDNIKSLQFVVYYIVIGVVLGAIVEVFVPGQWILYMFKPGKWWSVLFAALLGVPLYACGGGTIPIIDKLIQQGMSRGAALAFFIVGPATRVTPIMALATVLRPIFILIYILLIIVFSVITGMVYS